MIMFTAICIAILGNEIIHELTLAGYTTLRIELIVDSVAYLGQYGWFRVETENNGYRIHISNFTGNLSRYIPNHSFNTVYITTYK